MQITVNVPDEIAARMLGHGMSQGHALLELAGYIACENGRISEFEYMTLLGLETRFELHAVMKRIRIETEAVEAEDWRQELASLATLAEVRKVSKSG